MDLVPLRQDNLMVRPSFDIFREVLDGVSNKRRRKPIYYIDAERSIGNDAGGRGERGPEIREYIE